MGRALAETGMTTPGCLEHASWKFRHRKVIPKQRPSHPNPQNPGSAELDPLPDPPTTISHRPMALNAGINNSLAPRCPRSILPPHATTATCARIRMQRLEAHT
ncbi:hypothetical protein BD779DRAFT_1675436 [Infundibulicybe gibba]|nr:hypothetical protein BD779DRAFT_1675436 [Infundibulicybe gibba]